MEKKWQVAEQAPEEFIKKFSQYTPAVAQLFYNRGINEPAEAENFIKADYYEHIHDPFMFVDMQKAVSRIFAAIQNNEKILLYGDYDADGVTSLSVLSNTLKVLGIKDFLVYIPHREEDGFGLNKKAIADYADQGVKLIITVDCGSTNVDEVALANERGVDVIITDHHQLPAELPAAYAIINPKRADDNYPFDMLCGVGVAYKLSQAIIKTTAKDQPDFFDYQQLEKWGGYEGWQKWLLDLVAIGTVGDLGPLVGENRVLVKWGIKVLKQTKRPGLVELLKHTNADKRLDSQTIGFQIAPRINAAGRLSHALTAYQLLVTDDQLEANNLAQALQDINLQRQKITDTLVRSARQQIAQQSDLQNCLMVYGEDWQPGLVGLIAGRLCDEYYRPVLAMTGSRGAIMGSGRSIAQLNITDSLTQVEVHLDRYGGHAQACGFTLKSDVAKKQFETDLMKIVDEKLAGLELLPILEIDLEMDFSDLTWEMVNELALFEPFGEANQKPRFLIRNLKVDGVDFVGNEEKHLRLFVNQGSAQSKKAMGFGMSEQWKDKLQPGDLIDLVCEIGINEWNGYKDIEMRVVDMKINSESDLTTVANS